jgi:hypothetical protein
VGACLHNNAFWRFLFLGSHFDVGAVHPDDFGL